MSEQMASESGAGGRAFARWLMLAGLSMALYGCTGGLSCGGASSGCVNGYDYPQSQLTNGVVAVDDGVRVRMTQAALDFLSDNLRELLLTAFTPDPQNPDRLRFDLGPFDLANSGLGNARIGRSPSGDLFPTWVILDAAELSERLSFEFVNVGARGGLRVRVEDLPLGLDARVYADWLTFGTGACDLDGSNCPADDPDCGIATTLSFDVTVYPDVGTGPACDPGAPECFLIDVQLERFSLGGLGSGSIAVSVPPHVDATGSGNGCDQAGAPALCEPECSDPFFGREASEECDWLCGAGDILVDVVAELGGFISSTLEPVLAALLEGAIRDALADFDGAPLSASDRYDLVGLAPDVVNPTALDLGYALAPTGDAFDVNCPSGVNCAATRGMDFALKSGAEAAPAIAGEEGEPPHPCVNPLEGADFAALFGAGEFIAPDTQPLDGQFEGVPYHLGASVARQGMNQVLFAAYNTGVLCIEVDSDTVHALSNGDFPLTAGTLDLLTEGRLRQFAAPTAPAVVTLSPSAPPRLRFGAGTEEEGHMVLEWDEVVVSFYVLVYERFARVFAVSTDISAQVTLLPDPATETLQLAIVDGPSIDGFVERYNELLPGVAFDEVLESLVGLAFDALLGDDLAFSYDLASALSDALNIPLYIDFRGLETVPATGTREFLNFYLSLSDTPPQPRTAGIPLRFSLAEESGLYRPADMPRVDGSAPRPARRLPTGQVRLAGRVAPLTPGVEYFAQVDFGLWRGPFVAEPGGMLVIEDPKLALVGKHQVQLRGRRAGAPGTLVPAAAALSVWVDPYRPWAELSVERGGVLANGSDVGAAPQDLAFSWSEDGGPYSDFGAERFRSMADLEGVRRLSVRARDPAGNVSRPVTIDLGSVRARRR